MGISKLGFTLDITHESIFAEYLFKKNMTAYGDIKQYLLVVWNMFYDFPYIGNVIIPTDEVIFFRGVGSTTNQNKILNMTMILMNIEAMGMNIDEISHNLGMS